MTAVVNGIGNKLVVRIVHTQDHAHDKYSVFTLYVMTPTLGTTSERYFT